MTDDQIILAAGEVDVFVTELMNEYKMNIIDISAVINSRLRMISALDELQDDFDDLICTQGRSRTDIHFGLNETALPICLQGLGAGER